MQWPGRRTSAAQSLLDCMCNYTYIRDMAHRLSGPDIGNECVCLGVRKAARLVARRYDGAFRSLGMTSGQFSILAALLRETAVPLGSLADLLGMDRTTLTRNLRPLEQGRLVETAHAEHDRRIRGLQLTDAGRALLDRAIPLWRAVQVESNRRLGKGGWREFKSQLQSLG